MLGHRLQDLEVLWKGLSSATRVIDGNRHRATGSQRKGHGHAVVVVGVDVRG